MEPDRIVESKMPTTKLRHKKTRAAVVVGAVAALAAVTLAGTLWRTSRPDTTPLLPNSGATLAKVSARDRPTTGERFVLNESLVRPGFEPGDGFLLRHRGHGPWFFDRVDSPTTPGGVGYVTSATECADALIAAGSSGASSTAMDRVEQTPPSIATVWRNADGTEWKQIVINGVPAGSVITGVVSGRSIGQPKRLVASARTLSLTSDAFALTSDDCGVTWGKRELPKGSGPGFEFAAAITATAGGFVIAGSIDGRSPDGRSIIIWTSPDGFTWKASSRPDTSFFGYLPRSVALDGATVVITGGDSRTADTRIFTWDGSPGAWFTAETITREPGQALGTIASTVGVLTMQPSLENGTLHMVRQSAGTVKVDAVPGISTRDFSVMTFLGDGGTQAWVVGQRTNTAELVTWSITLGSSVTVE